MDRFLRADPARRPHTSHKVIISSPAIEQQETLLLQHAIVLTATERRHATSPLAIGKVLEKDLKIPPHLLCITSHHPEDFFVQFTLPAHRDLAVRQGSLMLDGVRFLLEPWRDDAHALEEKWDLNVRVVIENLLMKLWTLEGAEEALGDKVHVDRIDSRTYERADIKTFAVWVWAWDFAHIPIRRTLWKFARGAGRVTEMYGYSPPVREVAPPPHVKRYDILLHVDLYEDWTPLSPLSSHSGQSGIPSDEEPNTRPHPRRGRGALLFGSEDRRAANGGAGPVKRIGTRVASIGCGGLSLTGPTRREHDNGDQAGHRRSWKEALLGKNLAAATSKAPTSSSTSRKHSRTPKSHHRQGAPRGHRDYPKQASSLWTAHLCWHVLSPSEPQQILFSRKIRA